MSSSRSALDSAFVVPPTYVASESRELDWLRRYRRGSQLLAGPWYARCKRAMDLTLVIVMAPVALTIFAICAALIKLESPGGPVMFKQMRTGRDGRRFPMFKFRTMVPNAEEMKRTLMHLNELQWPDFKITNDPRITRVGRLLRKTSMDELPQLLNVLRGEMSFVGPRPTSFAPDTYSLWQTERLDVIPGITGLWQIVGRAETEFDERLRLDVAYIERRCIRLDIELMLRTGLAVFAARGAR